MERERGRWRAGVCAPLANLPPIIHAARAHTYARPHRPEEEPCVSPFPLRPQFSYLLLQPRLQRERLVRGRRGREPRLGGRRLRLGGLPLRDGGLLLALPLLLTLPLSLLLRAVAVVAAVGKGESVRACGTKTRCSDARERGPIDVRPSISLHAPGGGGAEAGAHGRVCVFGGGEAKCGASTPDKRSEQRGRVLSLFRSTLASSSERGRHRARAPFLLPTPPRHAHTHPLLAPAPTSRAPASPPRVRAVPRPTGIETDRRSPI